MIHVALASAYPTEAEARAALSDENNYAPGYRAFTGSDAPYLGVWRMPEPYRTAVHVFADTTAEALEAIGWTRSEAPDCLCSGETPHPERGMQPGAAADHHARPAEVEVRPPAKVQCPTWGCRADRSHEGDCNVPAGETED